MKIDLSSFELDTIRTALAIELQTLTEWVMINTSNTGTRHVKLDQMKRITFLLHKLKG